MGNIGDLTGGILIGLISIEAIASINVLTFVFAFVGLFMIRKNLVSIEAEMTFDKTLSHKHYWSHMVRSLKTLFAMKDVVMLLGLGLVGTSLINAAYSLIALPLSKTPFLGMSPGQTLSIVSVGCSICMIFK